MAKQLSKMTIAQLRAEIARRQTVLPKLQKKRAVLLKEIGKIDRQIKALAGQAAQPAKRKGSQPGTAKATTSSASSGKSLVQCIRDVLGGSKGGMRVKDIVPAVEKAGYKSAAKDFYNLVAAAVRGDEFTKLGRGIYTVKTGLAVKQTKKVAKAKKVKQASKKSPKAGVKKAAAPKAGRKNKKYAQTAEQFVLGLVKGKGAITSDINKAWQAAGRTGRADNTLNKMLKSKKLKRTPLKGRKGSIYTTA